MRVVAGTTTQIADGLHVAPVDSKNEAVVCPGHGTKHSSLAESGTEAGGGPAARGGPAPRRARQGGGTLPMSRCKQEIWCCAWHGGDVALEPAPRKVTFCSPLLANFGMLDDSVQPVVALGKSHHLPAAAAFHPGPRTTRPGFCPVCSPSFKTCTPFTQTSMTPVAYWCGRS